MRATDRGAASAIGVVPGTAAAQTRMLSDRRSDSSWTNRLKNRLTIRPPSSRPRDVRQRFVVDLLLVAVRFAGDAGSAAGGAASAGTGAGSTIISSSGGSFFEF